MIDNVEENATHLPPIITDGEHGRCGAQPEIFLIPQATNSALTLHISEGHVQPHTLLCSQAVLEGKSPAAHDNTCSQPTGHCQAIAEGGLGRYKS